MSTRTWFQRLTLAALAAWLTGFAIAPAARAEDYVLGAEDVLQVSVWLHPELERSVTVSADGNVVLPPVGEIHAAGLTSKQLADRVSDRLSAYLRQTTTVTITVTQYMSRSVYVSGAVSKPGRYGFEQIPSLVDAINAAGGAIAGADLANVQVIRKEGDVRRTLPADVAGVLRDGDTSKLPALKPGDTVIIPQASTGVTAGAAPAGEGVAVLGQVVRPGYYPASQVPDLFTLLAVAGGTTERANWSDVRVLSRGEGGVTVARLDLRAVLDRGARASPTVKSGDVVVVMPKGPNVWAGVVGVMTLSREVLNVVVLVDYFKGRTSN